MKNKKKWENFKWEIIKWNEMEVIKLVEGEKKRSGRKNKEVYRKATLKHLFPSFEELNEGGRMGYPVERRKIKAC